MRVVFLDFDGVLNSRDYQIRNPPHALRDFCTEQDLDPEAVQRLNRILEATDARVVISSSWRIVFPRRCDLRELLQRRGLIAGRVMDYTPRLGRSEDRERYRGEEIGEWLKTWPRKVTSYVVLDDDSDAGYGHADRFIHTDWEHGLLDEHVARAIHILSAEAGE